MTFFEWLQAQVDRSDPVGDIARDIIEDARANALTYKTCGEWVRRVQSEGGSERAMAALDRARREYEARPK